MTVKFNCPRCKELIAFADKHIGKRARCLTCGQILIIPSQDGQKPQKIETPVVKVPIPGFYRAVLLGSWKLFIDRESVTLLIFIAAAVCFKFFLARAICFINYITFAVAWALLLGFYLNIIHESALGADKLPEIYLGTPLTFFWYLVQPFLLFFFTIAVVQLPFIIALTLLQDKGITTENMWALELGPRLFLQVPFILGLFVFPMAILHLAVGQDITLLRPDHLFKPILKAPVAYLLAVALLVGFGVLCTLSSGYDAELPRSEIAARLALNLLAQVVAIIAMRAIGLFYRHYQCHFPW